MYKFAVIRKLRKSDEKDCKKSAECIVDPSKLTTFASALRNKRYRNKDKVLRHIELTAVSREISKQRIKSNRIARFEYNR
ncbi:hypothetical protein [Flavobacterium sp. 140616W15]|uniref:hypothetical protein n=1 Tax=Flavobacterium sp. 140616W15 TaxID=2478552 RepID=UPI000F0CB26E|nr:hypothetical protein [Flavobacterium sp. 140616W15]AYN04232.1 hypothetical protein EAG11_08545 [Flavobacterium sp. 140616W15]